MCLLKLNRTHFPLTGLGVSDRLTNVPVHFCLFRNHPNPFISFTSFRYSVAKPAKHLQSGGQLVEILVNGQQKAGTYEIKWNGKDEEGKLCLLGSIL